MGLDKVDVVHDVAISLGGATAGLGDCCAYPVADRTQDGLLVCIYRCGAETQTYDGIPVARTSRDRGKTWSDPVVLFDGRSLDPPESVLNPQVVVVPDGSLLALFQAVVATRPDEDPFTSREGFAQARRYYKTHSYDNGRTWTVPERITHLERPIHGLSGRSFALPNGDLFINVTYAPTGGEVGWKKWTPKSE